MVFWRGEGSASVRFNGQTVQADATGGKWAVKLEPMEYGGPYDMEFVLDGKTVVLKDIYVGEVWFAGGQSNMEMPLFRTEGGLNEAKTALNEKIRFFIVPRRFKKKVDTFGWHFEKTVEEDKAWEICTEQSALSFTAIGYYVAKGLHEKLGVAVGVISCNWGSTPIEPYIARKYFYEHDL